MQGTANCEAIRRSEAKPNGVIRGLARFLPPGEGGLVADKRARRKGRTVSHRSPRLVRRLLGTGLHGPQRRVTAPNPYFLSGESFPRAPSRRVRSVCFWSASARRVRVRAAAALEAGLGDLAACWSAPCWEPGWPALRNGCGLPVLLIHAGKVFPTTPSRRDRPVCFGRRIYYAPVRELPPRGKPRD